MRNQVKKSSSVGKRRRSRRERGFSLIIVFMLMFTMVGLSATALMNTQRSLQVASSDREAAIALGAAEYAVAQAKAFLASQTYDANTGWTGLLKDANSATKRCQTVGGAGPGTQPTTDNAATDYMRSPANTVLSRWVFCVHNNAEDPGYVDVAHNTPANSANGDSDDSRDPKHLITIEAYGYGPNNASAHLRVTTGSPTLAAAHPATDAYAQEGAGATHSGSAGATESGLTLANNTTVSF